MEITWLGVSCFRLRSNDLAIITDPFPDFVGLSMGEPRALAVTVSHQHPDHNHWEGVGGDPKILKGPGEYELSGIYITGIMTQAGESDPPGKRNTAYLIEMDGLRLCHLGDVSNSLKSPQVEGLNAVDVLFLPVGGGSTVEVPEAREMIQALDPKVVIPMHYRLPGLSNDLNGLDVFLKEMGLLDAQPQARLNVTNSSLPPEMRVVMLEAQGLRDQA